MSYVCINVYLKDIHIHVINMITQLAETRNPQYRHWTFIWITL